MDTSMMTITTNEIDLPQIMLPPAALPVKASALMLVNEQLLFVEQNERGGWTSKFITSQDARAAFSGVEEDSGWLPAGVVRVGTNASGPWCVYSTPAQRVDVLFHGDEQVYNIPLPRLVLLGGNGKYYLWALKTEHFDQTATACAAPFPNTYSDGSICWGSNTPPAIDPGKMRKVWDLFFGSQFNEHLVENKSRENKNDVGVVLRALASKKAKKYPLADLAGTQQSIAATIDRILRVR
jgi:PRTRC genetic system protein B